jgi:hypothetical protein
MYPRDESRMNLRAHMVAAYAGDGGGKSLGRDVGANPRSAKDYYRTGIVPRDRVLAALLALRERLCRRAEQMLRFIADIDARIERLRDEDAALEARRAARQGDTAGNRRRDRARRPVHPSVEKAAEA